MRLRTLLACGSLAWSVLPARATQDSGAPIALLTDVANSLNDLSEGDARAAREWNASCEADVRSLDLFVQSLARDSSSQKNALRAEEQALGLVAQTIEDLDRQIIRVEEELRVLQSNATGSEASVAAAGASLRQVDKVLARLHLEKSRRLRQRGRRQLDSRLAPESADGTQGGGEASPGEQDASLRVLQKDRRVLLQAEQEAVAEHSAQDSDHEKLIDEKKQQLADLQAQKRRAENKRVEKTAEEAQLRRSVTTGERQLGEYQALKDKWSSKCTLGERELETRRRLEQDAISQVQSSVAIIETVNTSNLISMDVRVMRDEGASFLQTQRVQHPIDDRGSSSLQAGILHTVSDGSFAARMRQAAGAGSSEKRALGPGAESSTGSAGEAAASAFLSEGSREKSDPFEEVGRMMTELIGRLQAEQIKDTDHDTYCSDSYTVNKQQHAASIEDIETLGIQIEFTGSQVTWFAQELSSCDTQVARLDEIDKASDELDARLAVGGATPPASVGQNKAKVLQARSLLQQHCNASYVHACDQAMESITDAAGRLDALLAWYPSFAGKLSTALAEVAATVTTLKSVYATERAWANTEVARLRQSETSMKRDKSRAEGTRAGLEAQRRQIDRECGPGTTATERTRRKQEQLEALKDALQVLGES